MGGESVKFLVPAAKTPFLSFLEDGGFEKKYERVQFGREVFQKKVWSWEIWVLTNILLEFRYAYDMAYDMMLLHLWENGPLKKTFKVVETLLGVGFWNT